MPSEDVAIALGHPNASVRFALAGTRHVIANYRVRFEEPPPAGREGVPDTRLVFLGEDPQGPTRVRRPRCLTRLRLSGRPRNRPRPQESPAAGPSTTNRPDWFMFCEGQRTRAKSPVNTGPSGRRFARVRRLLVVAALANPATDRNPPANPPHAISGRRPVRLSRARRGGWERHHHVRGSSKQVTYATSGSQLART